MRYAIYLLLLAITGCGTSSAFLDDSSKTAVDRDEELKKNLREGRSPEEQEEMIKDLRGIFEGQSQDK